MHHAPDRRRARPRVQLLAWLDAGEIGMVTGVDAKFNIAIANTNGREIRHLPETGGGSFMDLGCYPLNWALQTVRNRPAHIEAKAVVTALGVDERMDVVLTFPGAVKATLSSSMAEGEKFSASLLLKGTKGEIEFINPLAPHYGASLTLKAGAKTLSVRMSRITTYTWQLETVIHAL